MVGRSGFIDLSAFYFGPKIFADLLTIYAVTGKKYDILNRYDTGNKGDKL